MSRAITLFLIGMLVISGVCLGELISIPLPGLTGHYVASGSSMKIANIYCGIQAYYGVSLGWLGDFAIDMWDVGVETTGKVMQSMNVSESK